MPGPTLPPMTGMDESGHVRSPVRVVVVDDQQPFRAAARAVIERTDGFAFAGEAESGEAAVELVDAVGPALVLMDIKLPGIDGIEATRRVADRTIVFLCSTYAPDALPAGAAECGAAAYVHKEELSADLLTRLWADASLRS